MSHRRIWQSAVAGALGVALLGLGVPRTVAAWNSIEGVALYRGMRDGATPSDDDLARGVEGLEFAVSWVPAAERYRALAGLEVEQARRLVAGDPRRRELDDKAERNLASAIVADPTDPWACLTLAQLRQERGASPRDIIIPVVHSLDVAPNQREMWLWRAWYLLAYWPALKLDELFIARSQFRTIWRTDPKMHRPLVEMAIRLRQTMVLSWALAEEPEAKAEISRLEAEISSPAKP